MGRMRVGLPKGRLPGTRKEAPSVLLKVMNATHLPVYDGVEALKDARLERLDEGRRRR